MRPLFTVHGGEFLVGSEVERRFPRANVWVPSKDSGIDLLVTSTRSSRAVSLQVKYSRDYSMHHPGLALAVCGWWTLDRIKLAKSRADLWVFVLLPFTLRRSPDRRLIHYMIIPPRELAKRLSRIHRRGRRIQSYLWVSRHPKKCWEARGLTRNAEDAIAGGRYSDRRRDFTRYLDAWGALTRRLRL